MNIVVIKSIQGMEHYVNINHIVSFKASGNEGLLIYLSNGENLVTREYNCADRFLRTIRNIQRLEYIRKGA